MEHRTLAIVGSPKIDRRSDYPPLTLLPRPNSF